MAGVTSISCIRPIFSGQPAEHTLLARTVIVIEDDSGYVDIVPYSAIRRLRVLQAME